MDKKTQPHNKSASDRKSLFSETAQIEQVEKPPEFRSTSNLIQLQNKRPAISGPVTPEKILSLQRTVGNRVVQRLLFPNQIHPTQELNRQIGAIDPEIQRTLPEAATYTNLDPTDALLVAVGTAVQNYNTVVSDKLKTAAQYQTAMNRLQGVDRAIYVWFNQVSGVNQRLSASPHYATVKSLTSATEKEHEKLIDSTKNMLDVLPFDDIGLLEPEKTQLKTLWQEIVNNRGKIQILGSTSYKKRVRAELAKILSSPTGRRMLTFLNTPKPGEIRGSLQAKLNNIYISEKLTNLPKDVRKASPDLVEQIGSEATPLGIKDLDPLRSIEAVTEVTSSPIDPLAAPLDATEYPSVDSTHLSNVREAAWGGTARGFAINGKKYTFNANTTGAYVTSFPGQSLDAAKGTRNEIFNPSWVTLGHELGHAANFKAGATTLKKNELLDPLTNNNPDSMIWDNPEELLNIENVENALRNESGLTEREGHQPPAWAGNLVRPIRAALEKPLNELYQSDAAWYDLPQWFTLYTKIHSQTKAAELLDVDRHQELQDEVEAFKIKWTPKKFNAWKKR